MIAGLMLYAVVVGTLLAGAAVLGERTLRLGRRPARAVWLVALAGTLGMPLLTLRRAALPEGSAGAVTSARVLTDATASRPRLPSLRWPALPARFDRPLLALWLILSLGVTASGAVGLARIARARRRWTGSVVEGHEVLLSERLGPLVMGLLRPRVVLPRWALELEEHDRRLILAHEEEHRAARDPLLLALGALAVAAAPWNPVVWWQARRLRVAIELDCDGRVLRRGAEPIAYGELLLRVGSRSGGRAGVLAAALRESDGSILERRLTMITTDVRGGWRRAMVAGVAAAAMIALACETPKPSPTEPVSAAKALEAAPQIVARTPSLLFIDGVEQPVKWRQDLSKEAFIAELAKAGITPNDIERIEVIKADAALRLFGERGRDGVIQIFTKKNGARPATDDKVAPSKERAALAQTIKLVVDGREVGPSEAKLDVRGPGEAYVVTPGSRLRVTHIDVLAGPAAEAKYGAGAGKVIEVATR